MKKLLATLLASTMALSAIGGLVACGNDDEEEKVTPIPATGITLNRTAVEGAPDSQWGVAATLTPFNSNSQVEWTVANGNIASVSAGGVNNEAVLVNLLDTGTTTVTATVDGFSASFTVTVGEWQRFMIVGSVNGWDATDASEEWLFVQDTTDKHLWTIEVDMVAGDGGTMVKIVAAGKDAETGKYTGLGWGGGYNLGINNGTAAEGKDDVMKAAGGELNIHNDGNSGNITAEADGRYKFTLRTKSGGGFDSLSYERVGDIAA